MTSQETDMRFVYLSAIRGNNHMITAEYADTIPVTAEIKIGNRKRIAPIPTGRQIALTF